MAVKLALLWLVLLACLTVRQQAVWADDVSLWRQAVRVSPHSPRAAINLAAAYRRADQPALAVLWLVRADAALAGHPREAEYRRWIHAQVIGLAVFGYPVCDSLLLAAYC